MTEIIYLLPSKRSLAVIKRPELKFGAFPSLRRRKFEKIRPDTSGSQGIRFKQDTSGLNDVGIYYVRIFVCIFSSGPPTVEDGFQRCGAARNRQRR